MIRLAFYPPSFFKTLILSAWAWPHTINQQYSHVMQYRAFYCNLHYVQLWFTNSRAPSKYGDTSHQASNCRHRTVTCQYHRYLIYSSASSAHFSPGHGSIWITIVSPDFLLSSQILRLFLGDCIPSSLFWVCPGVSSSWMCL